MNTQQNKPVPKYDCTQAEHYAICEIGWTSCSEHLVEFTNLKAFYTPAYILAKKAAINSARNLPSLQARTGPTEVARIELSNKGTECLVKWQALKRYIADAFSSALQKTKLESAGAEYYDTAAKENWEDLVLLVTQGSNFIANDSVALLANDNMPATFEAEFNTLKDEYLALYNDFKSKEQVAEEMTTAKINANNVLHDELMKMFKDGVHIFRSNEAIRNRFIWTKVKELVSSSTGNPNEVTLSGVLTDNVTGEPIAGAQFVVGPHTFTTEGDGSFLKKFVIDEPTTYPVTITATGYVTESTTYQFTPGVDITQDVQMTPVQVGSLSGKVADAGTGTGINNASIIVTGNGINIMVNADANGDFNVSGIPVGSYTVTVNAAGYVGQSVSVTINANANTVQNFSLVVMP